MSAQKSAAIIENLKRKSGTNDVLEEHIAVEEAVVGRPLVTGNKVTLLQDGAETYKAMFAAIKGAKDHINLESYIFDDDEIGRQFADMLIEKQSQGTQVNLIYDSVGSINTPRAFFDHMAEHGIRILEFNPVNPLAVKKEWLINNRDHRKLMIVDGRIAFVGGINISSVYSRGPFSKRPKIPKASTKKSDKDAPWRDTHMRLEGPAVSEFQQYFLQTWQQQKADPLPQKNYFPAIEKKGNDLVRAIGSSAGDPYNPIYVTLISAITNAENYVYITNAYFVPDPQFLQVLEAATKRGVDVRIILPSHTDSWLVLYAGRSYYTALLKAGVKIYERRGPLLHSKTVIVDGVWSSVGSTNLDWRSFVHNNELNAVVLGSEFAMQMDAMFEKDLKESTEINLQKWQRRSPISRIQEWVARRWEYWL
ncbi:MAG: cardiolipin synthase [Pseudomonadota bacterium]